MSWSSAVLFYGQMRQLLRTGMTLSQALPLAGGRGVEPYSRWAARWAAATAGGGSWADAMVASGEKPFPTALIRAGEGSGQLEILCGEIVSFYQHCIDVRRLVIQRMIYPLVLIHAAMMIPTLPGIIVKGWPIWTLIIGPMIFWGIIGGLAVLWHFGQRGGVIARLSLLPGPRSLTRSMVTANVALVLRAGLGAGMLAHQALELAADSCGHRVWQQTLRKQAKGIFNGEVPNLSAALEAADCAADVMALIYTGEVSGELESSLDRVANLERERFRERVTWVARIGTGILIAAAMIYAALTIITMYHQIAIAPMQELLQD